MAYAAWSVVFGEQPSAAKWNILGTNDAAFNAGTGFGTNVIGDASLIYGKVRTRQGGSATNWATPGTTTFDYKGTNTFMQCGSIANDASPKTITFPTAFNQVPNVFAVPITAIGVNCYVSVVTATATNFTCQVVTDAGAANTAQTINWIAFGQ